MTLNADGANNDIIFQSNGTTKATLDQAGLLTASGVTVTGVVNVGTGAISSVDSNSIVVGSGATNLRMIGVTNDIRPANADGTNSDNDIDLGDANARFKDLYLSGGLLVGGTGAANTLSDYETGTYTVVASGSSSGSGNVGTGIYTKIGRIVHINIIIIAETFPTFSGSLQMSLPFTGSNQSSREERGADIYFYPLASWTQGSNFNGCVPYVYGANPTVMLFSSKNVNADRQTPISNQASGDSGVYARFSMTYTAT